MSAHAKAHPQEKPYHPHRPLAGLLFGFVFLLGIFSVHETRTWLHIKTGALIWSERSVPAKDPFSHTMAGRPWTTDSWLADVAFYLTDRNFGPSGLVVLKSLALALAFALLLPLNPGSPLAAAGVLGLGAAANWPGFAETPVAMDLLILALMIRTLRPRRPISPGLLARVAVLELFWANWHGTAAVLGLWLVAVKVFKASMGTAKMERLAALGLGALALASLALNPHGLQVAAHLFHGPSWSGAWQPVSPWLNLYGLFVLAGAAACWVCLQQEFFLTITAATLLALSLVFAELRPLYVLASCPAINLALGHVLAPSKETPLRLAGLAAGLAALLCLHALAVYDPLAGASGYGAASLEGALHYLKANGVTGRIFNEAEAGAEVLARTERPVFVDERVSFYGEAFLRDAGRWPRIFGQLDGVYGFDYALIPNRRAGYPARILDEDPGWRLAYADDSALVYIKRTGANGWLAQDMPRRLVEPNRLWPESLDPALAETRKVPKVLEELDRWILQAPESLQALIWKAYALDRLRLSPKADRLLVLARGSRLSSDPELSAAMAQVWEKRGEIRRARDLYERAALLARRRGESRLEAEILKPLAHLHRRQGKSSAAAAAEERAFSLLSRAQELP